MKSSFVILLTVVFPLSGLFAAQSSGWGLDVHYDRFDDKTKVSTVPSKVGNALGAKQEKQELHLQATYECTGDTSRCRPGNIELRFLSRSVGEYTGSNQLSFIADGKRIQRSVKWTGEYEQKVLTEHVTATIKFEELLILANAEKVEGRLGGTTFTFSDDNFAAIRAVACEISPAS
jgi:hypothetical protein